MLDRPKVELVAMRGCCEEAHHTSSTHYIPCNAPATQIIIADGRETRMCDMCAYHSVKNRGMEKVRDIPESDRVAPHRGHNNPPDPIDTITAQYDDNRTEAESRLDGKPVENEAQMKEADELRGLMRDLRLALEKGQKSATAPLYDAYKAELDRWKPEIEDAKRIEAGLVGIIDPFKRKLAAEKAEADRLAQAAAWEATRKAQEAARLADATNIEATRAAAAAMAEAEEAQARAKATSADTVKGMRTVTRYRLIDPVLLARHLWTNDRDAQGAYHIDRATKLGLDLPGIFEKYQEKEAY